MRNSLVAATMLAGALPAAPATTQDARASFERNLAAYKLSEASQDFDRLVEARRPATGGPRPDPELNALAGRLALKRGQIPAALALLEHAPNLPEVALARGQALLMAGRIAEALAVLGPLAAGDAPAPIRASAARARIEALLIADPAAAAAAIAASAPVRGADAAHEWEWALFEGQAALLLGREAEAARAAQAAWSAASRGAASAGAPSRVGALLGVLAQRRGDHEQAIASLGVASVPHQTTSDIVKALTHRLPVCGTQVTRDDMIVVALHRDDEANALRMSPLWASRPAILGPFLNGLYAEALTHKTPVATLTLALRCRTAPATRAPAPAEDEMARWAVQRGLYPEASYVSDHTGTELSEAGRQLDALEARYGADSPWLLGVLLKLRDRTSQRLLQSGDVSPLRLIELNGRIARIMRAIGGTEAFFPRGAELFLGIAPPPANPYSDAARAQWFESFKALLRGATPAIVYEVVLDDRAEKALSPEQRREALEIAAGRVRGAFGAADPRTLSIEIARVHNARALGDMTLLRALVRGAALPADICMLRERPPRLTGNDITDHDFPTLGLLTDLAGQSVLEFDLDASGRHIAERVIVSAPAFLFDEAIARRIGSIAYDPAESPAGTTGCRGLQQHIRWEFPPADKDEEDTAPMIWTPGV